MREDAQGQESKAMEVVWASRMFMELMVEYKTDAYLANLTNFQAKIETLFLDLNMA